jgi:hypothetical protein
MLGVLQTIAQATKTGTIQTRHRKTAACPQSNIQRFAFRCRKKRFFGDEAAQ